MLVAAPGRREGVLSDGPETLAGFAAEQSVGLTRFAYLLSGDRQTAEDLVQDALLGLFRRFGDGLSVAAPLAYARRAIVNAYLSRSRRRAASEIVTAVVPDVAGGDGMPSGDGDLWTAVSGLVDRQRAVLVMRYYLDLSDDAIALALNCRVGTVRSLAARAFAALRADPALARSTGRTPKP
jgi:RNA polymerase sigma-70 factor (sigma-E family)